MNVDKGRPVQNRMRQGLLFTAKKSLPPKTLSVAGAQQRQASLRNVWEAVPYSDTCTQPLPG
jgi:hypothetical protein